MTNPKRPVDPHHARSGAEPAASTDDAAEDQATQIAAETATFGPLASRMSNRSVRGSRPGSGS